MSFEKKHFYTPCVGLSVYMRSSQDRVPEVENWAREESGERGEGRGRGIKKDKGEGMARGWRSGIANGMRRDWGRGRRRGMMRDCGMGSGRGMGKVRKRPGEELK
jgi:hypothetical protein